MENEISRTTGLNHSISGQAGESLLRGKRGTHGFPAAQGIGFIRKSPSNMFFTDAEQTEEGRQVRNPQVNNLNAFVS